MLGTFGFVARHPLNRGRRWAAFRRLLRYQFATRTREETSFDWFGGAKLVVSRNMSGASGNIYCGLHEFADMGFFLHFLRPEDLFLDIGANVGSYAVLASKVCGAETIAFEPDARAAARLARNVEENQVDGRVTIMQVALADRAGEIGFSAGDDTTNRVMDDATAHRRVACARLGDLLGGRRPTAIKMDVEGAELQVLKGAGASLAFKLLQAVETESADPGVVQLLEDAGFVRAWYDPFSRSLDLAPNAIAANNALFVRDVEFCRSRLRDAPVRTIYGARL